MTSGFRRSARLVAAAVLTLLPFTSAAAQEFDHSALTSVLGAYVSDAGVDYARLEANRAALDGYVARLGAVTARQFAAWNRNEQIAYLLNAYNALVLRTVIDHYPIRRSLRPAALVRPANSVWQIPGFFDDIKRPVAGEQATLDMIEHAWLRPRYREPRVHFALVCAAHSCPPLRAEAYEASRLDQQLNDQARRFLADRERNRFDIGRGRVFLSEIFKWFREDFGKTEADLLSFIARHVEPATGEWLREGTAQLSFIDYDWTLNDVAAR